MENQSGKTVPSCDFKFLLYNEDNDLLKCTEDPTFYIPPGSPNSQYGSLLSAEEANSRNEYSPLESENSEMVSSGNIIAFEVYTPEPKSLNDEENSRKGPNDEISKLKTYMNSLEVDCENYQYQNEQLRNEIHSMSSDFDLLNKQYKQAKQTALQFEEQRQKDSVKLTDLAKLLDFVCGQEESQVTEGDSFEHYLDCLISKLEIARSNTMRLKETTDKGLSTAPKGPNQYFYHAAKPSTCMKSQKSSVHSASRSSWLNELGKPFLNKSQFSIAGHYNSPGSKLLVELQTGLSTCTSSIARLQKFQYLKRKYGHTSTFK